MRKLVLLIAVLFGVASAVAAYRYAAPHKSVPASQDSDSADFASLV